MEYVTGVEPAYKGFAIPCLAIQLHTYIITICFADALFARPQRNWWPHYRLSTKLLKVDVYLMAYVSKTNGTPWGNRTPPLRSESALS